MLEYLVINGPNLNRLGKREPGIYGVETLQDIEDRLSALAQQLGVTVDFFQSNHEGDIIDKIHEAHGRYQGIVINPGAFTHYSYAIRDAFGAVPVPFVEIHISNIHAREEFRQHSVLAPIAVGQIVGLGAYGYELALRALVHKLGGERA